MLLSPYPCEIQRFRRNFRPAGYLINVLLAIFKKKFPSPKKAAILNFRIFAKNGKTQTCFYLLNRARYSDFIKIFDSQLSEKCTVGSFQKIFPSPKMAAILNFQIFAKNGKTQTCFYLLNRARYSDFIKIFDSQLSEKCTVGSFQKIFPSPKMAAILNFQIFAKNGKT